MSDVSRVTRGLAIGRAKKRLQIFDSHAYMRLQFLRAVSYAVDSEKMLSESHSDADDDDDPEALEWLTIHSIRMMTHGHLVGNG